MKTTILLDLGNTLVRYYEREQFPAILRRAIGKARNLLTSREPLRVAEAAMWRRVDAENHEADDLSVRPLEDRLVRVFGLDEEGAQRVHQPASGLRPDPQAESLCHIDRLCGAFMEPIFSLAHVYDDVVPALEALRARGVRTAVVSNTPWGSPAHLWREELGRLGLRRLVDVDVFCGDVGWRKPDERIFRHALSLLRAEPDECIFVGDDPRWDVAGPRRVGMEAVLIDRTGSAPAGDAPTVRNLSELEGLLEQ